MLNKLERRFGRYAIPNLTLVLTAALGGTFVMQLLWPETAQMLMFDRQLILRGEYWRVLSFVIAAPGGNPILVVFGLYLFYLMGNALENEWGEFRFNLFIFVGYLATIVAAFCVPFGYATNEFLLGSVFLAFAYLYPDFLIYIFFILPVRIKWLALIAWLGYGLTMLFGDWMSRALATAAVANFLLFFSRDIVLTMKSARRKMEFQSKAIVEGSAAFHHCETCGATEQTHPNTSFFVCDECQGDHEYCDKHIHEHAHK